MHVLSTLGPNPAYLMDPRTGQDVAGGHGAQLAGSATPRAELPGVSGGGYGVELDGEGDYIATGVTDVFSNSRVTTLIGVVRRRSTTTDDVIFGSRQP
jgi:hypothetical protein